MKDIKAERLKKRQSDPTTEDWFLHNAINSMRDSCVKELFSYLSGWYKRRSHRCKRQYLVLTILSSVLMSLVPLLTTIKGVFASTNLFEIGVALLTFISGLCLLLLNTWHSQENWIRYRECADRLRSEIAKFNTNAGIYDRLPLEEKEKCFLENILLITDSESLIWSTTMKNDTVLKKSQ